MGIQKSMQKQSIVSASVEETQKFARDLAQKMLIRKHSFKNARVLGLEGNLGSGKTAFAQGFAQGLGIQEKILSPTFVILKKFEILNSKSATNSKYKFQNFYHIDCYRLEDSKELLALGWKEIIASPKNIVLVEWAERVKKILPKNATRLTFTVLQNHTRNICIYF